MDNDTSLHITFIHRYKRLKYKYKKRHFIATAKPEQAAEYNINSFISSLLEENAI